LRRGPPLALCAALGLGLGAAHGAGPDLTPFVGTWVFQSGSQFTLDCPALGALPPQVATGTPVSIYPGTTSDLVFDIGCRCMINMTLDATGQSAHAAGTQTCKVVPRGLQIAGDVNLLTLDFSAAPLLTMNLGANNVELKVQQRTCAASPDSTFTGMGTLARTSTSYATCGPEETAIGVLPAWSGGTTDCPFGAGHDGLQITMQNEVTNPCSDATGSRGEGSWLLPDDTRVHAPRCPTADEAAAHPADFNSTTLNFCRVDGTEFKPFTTSPTDRSQFYAVLKLGTAAACPPGSVRIQKQIDNEDDSTAPPSVAVGDIFPSVVLDPSLGTTTTLVFCYFQAAASAADTMTGFPDLGFPYAVFHRFTGEQPPWVIAKRWVFSDDEDGQKGIDSYEPSDNAAFEEVIENPDDNTYFNLAWVR
jgi:hypothetical protein